MKNSTQNQRHEIQLSFMGFGTPNLPDCLDDISKITKEIEKRWQGVKSFCLSFGKQLNLTLKIIMPKVLFDFGFIEKRNQHTNSADSKIQRDRKRNRLWNWYREWKESIKNGKQNINIPDFVYLID